MEAPVNDRRDPAPHIPTVLPHLERTGWRVEQVADARTGVWVAGGAGAEVDYPATGHSLLAPVEDRSAWYAERNRLVVEALAADGLPRHLLEVGAGNGAVAAHLRRLGVDAVAVEPAPGAARAAAERGVPTVCGLLDDLRLPDAALEAAGVFDVLEHVADPAPLLGELHRVLEPAGRLVVTVPAMPALWSQADELAGHHRRYRRSELVEQLAEAGFEPRSCAYAFVALVPFVAVVRALPHRLGRRRDPAREAQIGTRQVAGYGDVARALARGAFRAERALRRRVDLAVGTSLVGVFRRT